MKRFSTAGVAIIVFLSTIDTSVAAAPATLQDYLSYCRQAANLGDCWADVEISDVAINTAFVLAKGTGPRSCVPALPSGSEKEQAEKAAVQKVVAWIQAHPAMFSGTTRDGIDAAVKAIWACK